MKLWLISQTENDDYDTYDSAIVAAPDELWARFTHPSGDDGDWPQKWSSWCSSPDKVTVKEIGLAIDPDFEGVVLASYNAG